MGDSDKMILWQKRKPTAELVNIIAKNDECLNLSHKDEGQSTIEFTFAMMITLIMVFALFMVFRWAGLDLANRRFYHENTLTNDSLRPEQQLNPDFYKPRKIDAAYRGFDLKR